MVTATRQNRAWTAGCTVSSEDVHRHVIDCRSVYSHLSVHFVLMRNLASSVGDVLPTPSRCCPEAMLLMPTSDDLIKLL